MNNTSKGCLKNFWNGRLLVERKETTTTTINKRIREKQTPRVRKADIERERYYKERERERDE